MKKRTFFGWISFALLVVLVAAIVLRYQNTPPSEKPTSIRVAQAADFLLYLPLYVAVDGPFAADQNLRIEIVTTNGDDKTFAAVASGECQFGVADPTFAGVARAKGEGGRVIASIVNGVPFWGITKRTDIPYISDPKQLGTYRVATFPEPSTAFVLQSDMYASGGLQPHIVPGAFGNLLPMLDANQADIALELEPNVSIAVGQGARIVYSMGEQFKDFAITGVSTSDAYLVQHRDIAQRFVNAIEYAERYCHSHPDEAAAIVAKRFPSIPPEVAKTAVKRVIASGNVPRSALISSEAWRKAVELRVRRGDVKDQQAVLDALDMSFAQKAQLLPQK